MNQHFIAEKLGGATFTAALENRLEKKED